jgi:hypothetical protein
MEAGREHAAQHSAAHFQRFAGSQSETLTVSVKPDAISRA